MDMEKKGVIAASEPKWIPVTERLPERNRNVLTCSMVHPEDGMMVDFLADNGSWFWGDVYVVTHWMELPKPPKQEV